RIRPHQARRPVTHPPGAPSRLLPRPGASYAARAVTGRPCGIPGPPGSGRPADAPPRGRFLPLVAPGWRRHRRRGHAMIAHRVQSYGSYAVFALIALESLGIPLPGESALIAAALYARTTHHLNIAALAAAAAAGRHRRQRRVLDRQDRRPAPGRAVPALRP